MITGLLTLVALVVAIWLFMRSPRFGSGPGRETAKRIAASPHYKNRQFQNLHNTPSLTGDAGVFTVSRKFFFGKDKRNKPPTALPSVKTDLYSLPTLENVLVWFGHSSYFMQLDGKKILVDPVFSGNASPFSFTTGSFKGTDVYTPDDIPDVDYLLITHDHYDHLDYKTMVKLRHKIGKVVTGLGVGAHLERWGYERRQITELDWNEPVSMGAGFLIHAVPARHFSGRRFRRNGTLWVSFVLQTPQFKIFIGGDSGYDDHFKVAGDQYGPFDLAILENGQYNEYWRYIHMMPEEVVQAAIDLKAAVLLPVHWSKFSLSLHAWDEPIIRLTAEAKKKGLHVAHPMIGQALKLDSLHETPEWWKIAESKDR